MSLASVDDFFNDIRRQMPVTQQWAYFDHAAVAPLSLPAQRALQEWAADVAQHGDVHWGHWRKTIEGVREAAARLLNAETAEIALIRNTTEGISLVAEGFPWSPGDNVVVPAEEFPSNRFPWQNLHSRGVEVRTVPTRDERLELSQLEAACDSRTRIVAISWVGYATGWRNDLHALSEMAHAHGALLFVDGIQGLGVLPLDVKQTPIDFLAADGHKWLLGPEGAGILFVRQEQLDRLRPLGVGWNSVQHARDFSRTEMRLKSSAARYEGGSYGMGLLLALGASLEMLFSSGVNSLTDRILGITDKLCAGLAATGADIVSCRDDHRRSGIVSCIVPGADAKTHQQRCRDAGIVVSCRNGRLRLSPHCYTTHEDLERLLDVLTIGGAES